MEGGGGGGWSLLAWHILISWMRNRDWVEILEDARVEEGVVASAASSAPGPVWVELPADPPLVSPAARGFLCLCLSALASFCICHSVFGPCVRSAAITQPSVSEVSAQFCLLCVLCHFIPLFFVCLCICTFVWQFDLRITINIVFTFVFMPSVTLLWDNLESQFVWADSDLQVNYIYLCQER